MGGRDLWALFSFATILGCELHPNCWISSSLSVRGMGQRLARSGILKLFSLQNSLFKWYLQNLTYERDQSRTAGVEGLRLSPSHLPVVPELAPEVPLKNSIKIGWKPLS